MAGVMTQVTKAEWDILSDSELMAILNHALYLDSKQTRCTADTEIKEITEKARKYNLPSQDQYQRIFNSWLGSAGV